MNSYTTNSGQSTTSFFCTFDRQTAECTHLKIMDYNFDSIQETPPAVYEIGRQIKLILDGKATSLRARKFKKV